jgi:Protein of unknown function (DUF2924)
MNSMAAGLASLTRLNLHQLREEWANHYRSEAPSAMSPKLLQLAIGYKIQEEALGGLNRRTQLRLLSLKSDSGRRKASAGERTSPTLKSGTKMLREWRGKVHEVLALDDGRFAYNGKTYRSLTTIARQVTGVHQSGPKFFGLKILRVSANG